jgi:phosphate transport system permease protein
VTRVNGRSLPPAVRVAAFGASETRTDRARKGALAGRDRPLYVATAAASGLGLAVGTIALFTIAADAAAILALAILAATLAATAGLRYRRLGVVDRATTALAVVAAAGVLVLMVLPVYLYGAQVNGVIHRTAISAVLLLVLSGVVLSYALRRLLGGTPSAQDVSLYPLILLPVGLALLAYAMLLARVVVGGAGGLSLDLLTTAWGEQLSGSSTAYQIGLRNHILGTLLLMAMTCLFSLLPGIGAGIFLAEYPGFLSRVIGFSTTMLRAMSVFIIGVAAINLVGWAEVFPPASAISELIRGAFTAPGNDVIQAGKGSFITGAAFLSILVIPIIAKLTEEGLRSVPRELREGSIAAGATEGYGLRRILLPWAAPNIVTGLLLGAAEAAGSLAIIMFIAGDGEYGVSPTSTLTSLDFALFSTRYGSQGFIQSMGYRAVGRGGQDYANTAALLLLLITIGLTVVALLLRSRFTQRYRGSLTIG